MATCETCTNFFPIPQDADDFEAGKGDCVTQKEDEKGRFWLSKPVFNISDACPEFKHR